MAQLDFDKYNQEIKEWTTKALQSMKQNGGMLGINHRSGSPSSKPSLPSIRGAFKYDTGAIEVISFKFPRSLIYVHHGAGKGMAGTSGSSWLDRYGKPHKTNPNSTGKMNTGNRKSKPWFAMTMNGKQNGVDELATLVAQHMGSTITESILK